MSTEQRLTDLEVRYAHLERMVEELSDVVAAQARLLEQLRGELLQQRARLHPGVAPQDEPPPHY